MTTESVTEQINLLDLQLRVARLFVIEAQERAWFRPCRLGHPLGCWACRMKRYILRERFR